MKRFLYGFLIFSLFGMACDSNDNGNPGGSTDILQLISANIGTAKLSSIGLVSEVAADKPVLISFSRELDTTSVKNSIFIEEKSGDNILYETYYLDDRSSVSLIPEGNLDYLTEYTLTINDNLKGAMGETFAGLSFDFKTRNGTLLLDSIRLNGENLNISQRIKDIDFDLQIEAWFSDPLETEGLENKITLIARVGTVPLNLTLSENNRKLSISNLTPLDYYSEYILSISSNMASQNSYEFDGFLKNFYTRVDHTPKFPLISDEELLTRIQQQTFKYFWDFAHPVSGMARERNTSGDIVTTAGSGFGLMTIPVGIERGFITRSEGIIRLQKVLNFLQSADRFHGAWPHWMNGSTGKVVPFGTKDDGGDLVETAFMIQGLLTFRQYLDPNAPAENSMINQINTLWESVEWDWYTRGENVLYWHWSPNYNWEMNLKIKGYNEALLVYILAASSPGHGIDPVVYHEGWASNGGIVNGQSYYGYTLPLGYDYGGPLFFTHYSFLGLDPRNLSDMYADYWTQNVNHTLINQAYCIDNPRNYIAYSDSCWGLTGSDNQDGYSAHSPTNDLGVITPTAAISSIPYTPDQSMKAVKFFYFTLGDRLWGDYGFHDAFNPTENWWADSYLAIDQGPIVVMIENYRSQLLWNLFMSCPEVQQGLDNLGFSY